MGVLPYRQIHHEIIAMKILCVSGSPILNSKLDRGWGGSFSIPKILQSMHDNHGAEIVYLEMRLQKHADKYIHPHGRESYFDKPWGVLQLPPITGSDFSLDNFLLFLEYLILDGDFDCVFLMEHTHLPQIVKKIRSVSVIPILWYELDAITQGVIDSYKESLGFIDAIVAAEGPTAAHSIAAGCPEEKCHIVLNGADPSVFYPLDGCRKTILGSFVGNRNKNRDGYLDSMFFGPARALPEYKFMLRGNHYDQELTLNIGRSGPVMQNELNLIYNSSSLNVAAHLDRWESCPMVTGQKVFEIMASGSVVISHDTVGMREIVEHGVDGFLVNTPEEALAIYRKVAVSPEIVDGMGVRAREKIIGTHTVDHRVNEIMQIAGSL
jgi:hypothetical protein